MGEKKMTHDLLAIKLNPNHVKELLQETSDNTNSPYQRKIRIYDDPGEVARARNKMRRQRTNEIFTDEYFAQFHGQKEPTE